MTQVSGAVASTGGLPGLIYLTAVLSVSIGLCQSVPIPMLDGGHLVFYAIEGLMGRPLSPRFRISVPDRLRARHHAVHLCHLSMTSLTCPDR
jgi:membrane-associated protease RseP (regulator of RpoE activity)